MLARLASVVLLGKDTLARGDARREVTATLTATRLTKSSKYAVRVSRMVHLQLSDEGLAVRFGALELLFLAVCRWMATKELECKVLVVLSLLRSQRFKSLKLDKCFGAIAPTFVE